MLEAILLSLIDVPKEEHPTVGNPEKAQTQGATDENGEEPPQPKRPRAQETEAPGDRTMNPVVIDRKTIEMLITAIQ